METPKLDRLLHDDDHDFGGPTFVDPPVRVEANSAQFYKLVELAKDVVPITRARDSGRIRQHPVAGEILSPDHATTQFERPEAEPLTTTPFLRLDSPLTLDEHHHVEAPMTLDEPANDEKPYQEFEKLGLGAPKAPSTAVAKLLVSTYRLLGFAILTAIVLALVGYISITVFYMGSDSWLVPTVVSPTDDKVLALHRELASLQNERDRIAGELVTAERVIAAEQEFQKSFVEAIQSDLAGRRSALSRVRQLARAAAKTGEEIRRSTSDFAADSSQAMAQQYEAGMIDRHDMLGSKHQLAQISSSNLSLVERQAAFEAQASELSRQASALDALLANRDVPLSYDVLEIKRDYDASKLEVANAIATRTTLLASLARQDHVIATLKTSAHLRALEKHATVALVPYSNLDHATPGTILYGCTFEMVWCHEVGTVVQVLPGEVQFRHPHRDSQVRGQMIEIKMTDSAAAHADVLFAGGKPLKL